MVEGCWIFNSAAHSEARSTIGGIARGYGGEAPPSLSRFQVSKY